MIGFKPGFCKSLNLNHNYRRKQRRDIPAYSILWASNSTQSQKTTTSTPPHPLAKKKEKIFGASSHLYTTKYAPSKTYHLQK